MCRRMVRWSILYGSLTTVIEMDPFEFLEKIASLLDNRAARISPCVGELLQHYSRTGLCLFRNVGCRCIGESLCQSRAHCTWQIVRWFVMPSLYSIPSTIEVCCNRGTSGIEGSLSTAVGYAAASDKLNFIAIGDLSFFYDMNALWNVNVRSQPAYPFVE